MTTSNIPPELIDQGLRGAGTALLTALVKHISQHQPEIVRQIFADATARIADDSKFPGEETAALVARKILAHKEKAILDEITPKSTIGNGFQSNVMR